LFPFLSYNRVDQFQVGLDMNYQPKVGLLPGFKSRMMWATERKNAPGTSDGTWLYNFDIETALDKKRNATVGISLYQLTDDDHAGQVGVTENALAAYFFHWDYRDWFERDGYGLHAAFTWRNVWRASTRYDQDTYTSITQIADNTQGLFRKNADWRANPAVDDGNLRSVTFGLAYDTRSTPQFPRRGMWHQLAVETAGGSLGGDWTYLRYTGDLRAYLSPGPSHVVKARALLGTTSEGGDLPFQKTFAVGGIGTLRAYPFRHFRGRHVFLLNGDWSWEVLRRSSRNVAIKTGLSVVLFTDYGIAWDAPTWNLGDQKPGWDAGLGVGTTDETLRVYFARDLRAEHSPVNVTLRITRSY
jgi:outer membrane protein assembly factor BamA